MPFILKTYLIDLLFCFCCEFYYMLTEISTYPHIYISIYMCIYMGIYISIYISIYTSRKLNDCFLMHIIVS